MPLVIRISGTTLFFGIVGSSAKRFCRSFYDGHTYLEDIVNRVSNISRPLDWIAAMDDALSENKFFHSPSTGELKETTFRAATIKDITVEEIKEKKAFLLEHYYEEEKINGMTEDEINEKLRYIINSLRKFDFTRPDDLWTGIIDPDCLLIIDFPSKTIYTNMFQYFTYKLQYERDDKEQIRQISIYYEKITDLRVIYDMIINLREYGFQIFNVAEYPQMLKFIEFLYRDERVLRFLRTNSAADIMGWSRYIEKRKQEIETMEMGDEERTVKISIIRSTLSRIIQHFTVTKFDLTKKDKDVINEFLDFYYNHFKELMRKDIEITIDLLDRKKNE